MFASAIVFFAPALALALTGEQESCVTSMNKSGSKVASTQGKENSGCVKAAGSNKLIGQDADQCVVSDNKGKVQGARQKTDDTQTRKCSGPVPAFGFAPAIVTNTAAQNEELALLYDVFDSPLAPAILTDKDGAGCQAAVAKAYEKLASTRLKEFGSCKSSGFKADTISNAAQLIGCMDDDPKGKVEGARGKLADAVGGKCPSPPVPLTIAFPGCSAEAGSATAMTHCIARKTECHMCLMIADMDNVDAPCDQLDDGTVNQTCRQCLNGATEAPEQCDDGAESANCDVDCTFAVCGDGHKNVLAGEQCDDGDTTSGDGCSATCQTE